MSVNADETRLWDQFLAHAKRARAKPTFDTEEREPKIQIAEQFRAALAVARDGGEWLPAVKAALQGGLLINLTVRAHRDWFREWAATDPELLGQALGGFVDATVSAEERFASFARAAGKFEATGAATPPAAVLALGSLFNFATEPESLPLVREWHFRQMEKLLGYETRPVAPEVAYPQHLAFAGEVRSRMEEAGLGVRDMIDVQSLILIAALEQGFWTGSEPCPIGAPPSRPRGPAARKKPPAYLSACAVYRNEGPYLREWIEFHRLVGVERFFLYNHRSNDEHREMLAPYLEEGIVTVRDWDAEVLDQRVVYDHCLKEHGRQSRWIAFIDLDEFLFSPTGKSVPEMLREYEGWPGIGVNWAVFGMSGHETKPSGLVIENYLMRVDHPANRFIKSIVDPSRAVRCIMIHDFEYESLLTMDENHYPVHGVRSKSVSFSRLRINHYLTKSNEEARAKVDRPNKWRDHVRWRSDRLEDEFPQMADRTILDYVPAVREALARTAARSQASRSG
jgi:hypothetical protein